MSLPQSDFPFSLLVTSGCRDGGGCPLKVSVTEHGGTKRRCLPCRAHSWWGFNEGWRVPPPTRVTGGCWLPVRGWMGAAGWRPLGVPRAWWSRYMDLLHGGLFQNFPRSPRKLCKARCHIMSEASPHNFTYPTDGANQRGLRTALRGRGGKEFSVARNPPQTLQGTM